MTNSQKHCLISAVKSFYQNDHDACIAQIKKFKALNGSQKAAYLHFHEILIKHSKDESEVVYDRVADVLDVIWGYTSPHNRIWPEMLSNEIVWDEKDG